jgi:hypothetical protein
VGLSLMVRFYGLTPAPFGRSQPKDRKGLFFYIYSIFFSSKMSNAYKRNRRLIEFNRRLANTGQQIFSRMN